MDVRPLPGAAMNEVDDVWDGPALVIGDNSGEMTGAEVMAEGGSACVRSVVLATCVTVTSGPHVAIVTGVRASSVLTEVGNGTGSGTPHGLWLRDATGTATGGTLANPPPMSLPAVLVYYVYNITICRRVVFESSVAATEKDCNSTELQLETTELLVAVVPSPRKYQLQLPEMAADLQLVAVGRNRLQPTHKGLAGLMGMATGYGVAIVAVVTVTVVTGVVVVESLVELLGVAAEHCLAVAPSPATRPLLLLGCQALHLGLVSVWHWWLMLVLVLPCLVTLSIDSCTHYQPPPPPTRPCHQQQQDTVNDDKLKDNNDSDNNDKAISTTTRQHERCYSKKPAEPVIRVRVYISCDWSQLTATDCNQVRSQPVHTAHRKVVQLVTTGWPRFGRGCTGPGQMTNCYVPSGRINPTWIWDRFAEYTRRRSSVSRRRRLGRYARRDQGQGAKAQEREGVPQDIKAKGFIRERPSTYTTRAGAFKPSNPNTQPQTLISQSNQRPYKSAVTSVTYHTPIQAQAHPDPSGPALGGSRASRWETRLDVPPCVVMLLSHRPKRADIVLFKELLGHLGHKRNTNRLRLRLRPN
ncbi:hypothetical protein EDB83DRAFT_2322510 [Lactarius deliciosus]|nr:hypothetical protein EDB83DRAFT_2322510 [Lactarius deliciosus]